MDEVWKSIIGFEGYYEVSNYGNVRGLTRTVLHRNMPTVKDGMTLKKILSGRKRCQYLNVSLCKDGKHITGKVHRLVGTAFLPNPQNFPQINHLDGDKLNNHYTNLEWCDQSRNMLHAYKTGLNRSKCNLTIEQAQEAKKLRKTGMPVKIIAQKFNVHRVILDSMFSNRTYKTA